MSLRAKRSNLAQYSIFSPMIQARIFGYNFAVVKIVKAVLSLLQETFKGWQEANGSLLAAALA